VFARVEADVQITPTAWRVVPTLLCVLAALIVGVILALIA
jgi:hypothetical protein